MSSVSVHDSEYLHYLKYIRLFRNIKGFSGAQPETESSALLYR